MSRTAMCIAGGAAEGRHQTAGPLLKAGFSIVGDFSDVDHCVRAAGNIEEPDLVLLLSETMGEGAEGDVLAIKRSYPEARVVMLGGGATRAAFASYIDAGLDGYFPATLNGKALAQSLQVIVLGEQLYVAGSREAATTAVREDRRGSARRRKLQKASMVVDGRPGLVDGMILDMSDTGAKIRPTNMSRLPSRFELRCGYGRTYICEVVRRSGFYLGVQFVSPEPA